MKAHLFSGRTECERHGFTPHFWQHNKNQKAVKPGSLFSWKPEPFLTAEGRHVSCRPSEPTVRAAPPDTCTFTYPQTTMQLQTT